MWRTKRRHAFSTIVHALTNRMVPHYSSTVHCQISTVPNPVPSFDPIFAAGRSAGQSGPGFAGLPIGATHVPCGLHPPYRASLIPSASFSRSLPHRRRGPPLPPTSFPMGVVLFTPGRRSASRRSHQGPLLCKVCSGMVLSLPRRAGGGVGDHFGAILSFTGRLMASTKTPTPSSPSQGSAAGAHGESSICLLFILCYLPSCWGCMRAFYYFWVCLVLCRNRAW
jgi:hypothetical protein